MEGYGLIVIMFFFGLAGGIIGRIKGSSFFMWFLISGLVPFLGLMAAIFSRFENQELRRQCPGCGRIIKLHDAVCMRCGEELEFPEVAIGPSAAPAFQFTVDATTDGDGVSALSQQAPVVQYQETHYTRSPRERGVAARARSMSPSNGGERYCVQSTH